MNPRASFRKIEQVAPSADPGAGAQERSWLVFRLGTHILCASTLDVVGIIERPRVITALPFMPGYALGTFLFRDHTATAISLRKKLKVRAGEDTAKGPFIAARIRENLVAFWVDEVKDVIGETDVAWQPMPEMLEGDLFDRYAIRDGEIILHTSFAKLLEGEAGIDSVARWAASPSRGVNESGASRNPAEGAARIGASAAASAPAQTPPAPDTMTVADSDAAPEIGLAAGSEIDAAAGDDAPLQDAAPEFDGDDEPLAEPDGAQAQTSSAPIDPATAALASAATDEGKPITVAGSGFAPEVSLSHGTTIDVPQSADGASADLVRDHVHSSEWGAARIDLPTPQPAPDTAARELALSAADRSDSATAEDDQSPVFAQKHELDDRPAPDAARIDTPSQEFGFSDAGRGDTVAAQDDAMPESDDAPADAPVLQTASDAQISSPVQAPPPDALTFTASADAPEVACPGENAPGVAEGEAFAPPVSAHEHDAVRAGAVALRSAQSDTAIESENDCSPADPFGATPFDATPFGATDGEPVPPPDPEQIHARTHDPADAESRYGSRLRARGAGTWKPRALRGASPEPEAAARVVAPTQYEVGGPRVIWRETSAPGNPVGAAPIADDGIRRTEATDSAARSLQADYVPHPSAHADAAGQAPELGTPALPRAYWLGGAALTLVALVIAILLYLPGTAGDRPNPTTNESARAPSPVVTPPTRAISANLSSAGPAQADEPARAPVPQANASATAGAPAPSPAPTPIVNSGREPVAATGRPSQSAPGRSAVIESKTLTMTIEPTAQSARGPAPLKGASAAVAPAQSATPAAAGNIHIHVVVRGDTLSGIAKSYLRNAYRYPELARLSRIENPHLIYPGDTVRIEIREPRR